MQSRVVSDSLKETRDKRFQPGGGSQNGGFQPDASPKVLFCAKACKAVPLPILSKRPEIRIPAWRQLSKRRFSTRCPPKCYFVSNAQSRVLPILSKRPEIRIPAWRQLSKRWFCQSRLLPILSKRPEIRIPAWPALKRRFSTRCSPKALFCVKYARPRASDSLKETRDKDSSLAAALKRWFCASRAFPYLSKMTRDKDSSAGGML